MIKHAVSPATRGGEPDPYAAREVGKAVPVPRVLHQRSATITSDSKIPISKVFETPSDDEFANVEGDVFHVGKVMELPAASERNMDKANVKGCFGRGMPSANQADLIAAHRLMPVCRRSALLHHSLPMREAARRVLRWNRPLDVWW